MQLQAFGSTWSQAIVKFKQFFHMKVNIGDVMVHRDDSNDAQQSSLSGANIMARLLMIQGEASSCSSSSSALFGLLPGTLALSNITIAFAPRISAPAVCELLRVVTEAWAIYREETEVIAMEARDFRAAKQAHALHAKGLVHRLRSIISKSDRGLDLTWGANAPQGFDPRWKG